MVKNYLLLLALCLSYSIDAQIINIPDANFKLKLLQSDVTKSIAKDANFNNIKIDSNGNGEIEESEALLVYSLNIASSGILSLEGIQNFVNITGISCNNNKISSLEPLLTASNLSSVDCSQNLLTQLDLTKLTKLSSLYCTWNQLLSLDISGLSSLYYLECGSNQLTSINASGCKRLSAFYFSNNSDLATLNLSGCTALENLNCENLKLIDLNIAGCTALKTLKCSNNKLNKIDVTDLTSLTTLDFSKNQLTEATFKNLPVLTSLNVSENVLTSLDLNGLTALTSLYCSKNQIANLDLTTTSKLTSLSCSNNNLSQLVVKNLLKLSSFNCSFNNLAELDIVNLIYLNYLDCSNNKIKNLSLYSSSSLSSLYCGNNEITSLDLRGIRLSYLTCSNNKLTSLYIKNERTESLDFSNNPTLTYICSDDSQLTNINNLIAQYGYTNCTADSACSLKNDILFIQDPDFKTKLLSADVTNNVAKNSNKTAIKIDVNNDGEIQSSEIENIAYLDVSGANILDLKGVLYFEKLVQLNCSGNNLSILDLIGLKFITDLNCSKNQLTQLKIEGLTTLETLNCSNNKLTAFDNTSVYYFPNLKTLDCSINNFSALDFNPVNKIETVLCNDNKLVRANFIDLKSLITLNCSKNELSITDFKGLGNLITLDCSKNQLKTLSITDQIKLNTFNCDDNLLISLYLKNGTKNTTLSFNGNPGLSYVCVEPTKNTAIKNLISTYGYANCVTYTDCLYNDIVLIPDAKFKAKLVKASANSGTQTVMDANDKYIVVDVNKNGEIEISEALMVYKLNVISSDIASLEGILKFTNIRELYCGFNRLTTLDVSTLTELDDFNCSDNSIATLNITGLKKLTKFSCSSNKIETLDLSAAKEIKYLNTYGGQLSTLNIKGLTKLESIEIWGNSFAKKKTLDLSEFINLTNLICSSMELNGLKLPNAPKLERLDCSINYLTNLDLSNLNLKTLICFRNQLKTLDVNNSSNLSTLDCNSNLLESLFIKVGKAIKNLNFLSNYNLNFICTDESQVDTVRFMPIRPGFYCPNVNSYCSFTPGGTYYSINGNTKFDLNADGCDDKDVPVSNVKFNMVNGVNKSEFVADNTGSYFLPMGAGSYSMTPKLENPNYFKISPESITVSFPTQTSPLIKNFCLTADGSHQDLEIVILPTVPAVPGFDAKYKLIYKNKGNVTQSGSATLTFNDSVLDLVKSSTPASSQTTNKLVWDFSNLKPFESKEIEIVLNVNSPTEIPAINNSDILKFTATISSLGTDETPLDNNFEFNQTVVGSYDPNDKTCVEGNVIKSQLIGQYVHYLIRFENKGSYSAKNIVIKDMIDLSKFDISTLIPTSASHSYFTKISNNNKVEFVFENINLPFDNANNDGYIAFKIKTLSTLKVGDSFTNDANIYFDYNLPILTNKATSTFQTLGVQNFEFSNYFSLYPNPAKEILNISLKNDIEIESMSIYNILGQLIIAVPNAKNVSNVDVSRLKTGNYILKIKTDKGFSSAKFIKE